MSDKHRVLHLFSGKVDLAILPGDTVDINPKLSSTYLDDAQKLMKVLPEDYDLVLADPPYRIEDAQLWVELVVQMEEPINNVIADSCGGYRLRETTGAE